MSASFPTYQPRLLYIDLFCGAGGVTTGVSRVPGVQVVACVNHDATAIASHAANHPAALHYTEDIRTLDISPIAARVAMLRLRYPDTKVVLWHPVNVLISAARKAARRAIRTAAALRSTFTVTLKPCNRTIFRLKT